VDSYDALNDLLLAEGVHRLVQGDRASYSAISNFMVDGKGNLPEPSILDTPMEYVFVANKAAVALPKCKNPLNRPMPIAEPSVNLWLEWLMGKLENIWFYAGINDAESCSRCTLGELGLSPIEYLYLSANDNIFFTYLEARWRMKNGCFDDKVTIYAREPESDVYDITADEEGFSLYENEWRISRLRNLVLRGGVMKANDWIASANSDGEDEMAVDIDDLKSRYTSLRSCLSQLNMEMLSCLRSLDDLDEEACDNDKLAGMYELLCRCVESGLINSLPLYNRDMFICHVDSATLEKEYRIHPIFQKVDFDKAVEMQRSFIESFAYVCRQLDKRISSAEKIVRERSNERYTSAQYGSAFKKLLLDNFKIFPRFTLHHTLPEEKRKEYDEALRQGIDRYTNLSETGFEEWQSDVAEVREGMKIWHHLSMFENMCNGSTGKVSILQTTSDGDASLDKWLGCEVSDEADLQDVDSLVIYNSDALAKLGTKTDHVSYNAGIIIDAWPEFIPYKKQTAGMVFHCDQPDNEAPQSLLLALHPEFSAQGKKWEIEHVRELLDSTRFMLMNRAVEPDHIYRDSVLSTLFPLLSTISPRPFQGSGYLPPRRQGYVFNILDAFPGGHLLKIIGV
jgi:hypothetical protein